MAPGSKTNDEAPLIVPLVGVNVTEYPPRLVNVENQGAVSDEVSDTAIAEVAFRITRAPSSPSFAVYDTTPVWSLTTPRYGK